MELTNNASEAQNQSEQEVLKGITNQLDQANQRLGGMLVYTFGKDTGNGTYSQTKLFDSQPVKEGENTESYLVFSDIDGFRKISADRNDSSEYPYQNGAEVLKSAVELVRKQKKDSGHSDYIGDVTGDSSPGHNATRSGKFVFVLPRGIIAKNEPNAQFRYESASKEFVEKALTENVHIAKERAAAEAKRIQEEERRTNIGVAKEVAAELPALLGNQPTPNNL